MTDEMDYLAEAKSLAVSASAADSSAMQAALAQTATAYATIAMTEATRRLNGKLELLQTELSSLKEAVTDRHGFSSADHLRNINEQMERIAKG